jgi:PAS domain S-box-containing protein
MGWIDSVSAIDVIDDVFFLFDADGQLCDWNDTALEITGYTDAELSRMSVVQFFGEADATRVLDAHSDLVATGRTTIEAELVTSDGTRLPYEFKATRLNEDGEFRGFAGIGRDITERREQRETIESRARVLQEMYGVISETERPFNEQVRALLQVGCETFGTTRGVLARVNGDECVLEVVEPLDERFQDGDVLPLTATNCERVVATDETFVMRDTDSQTSPIVERPASTGTEVYCCAGAPVRTPDGLYGALCFFDEDRDEAFVQWHETVLDLMGQWVGSELERQRSHDRLERERDRMERFASFVSHDLRNPVGVLSGWLELLADPETNDPDTEVKALEYSLQAVDRMDMLIEDLLLLTRAGNPQADTTSAELSAVSVQAWDIVQTEGATLEFGADLVVEADRTRLQQLLENLFRNAVEHGGNAVTVSVGSLDDVDGFYVADDGPGIPAEHRARVFEEGFSTQESGTGLGLYIVEVIADAHGWDLAITDPDVGTRFEVTGIDVGE